MDLEYDNDADGAAATDSFFQATAAVVPSTELDCDGNVIDIDDESNVGTIWHNHHETQNTSTDALLAMEKNTKDEEENDEPAATTTPERAPNSREVSGFQAQSIEV